jgi:hypothetical protein
MAGNRNAPGFIRQNRRRGLIAEIPMNTCPLSLLTSRRSPDRPVLQPVFPRLLRYAGLLSVLPSLISPAFSQTPADWKATQDMHKACQIAFPSNWTVTPDGQATTSDGGRAVLVVGSDRPLTPLAPDMQKLLQVDRLIENSSKRVLYLTKPQGDTLQYIVDQQFKTKRCKLQLIVPKGYSDAEAMRIIGTLAPTH